MKIRVYTKSDKVIKDYSYKERVQKLGLTILLERRMRDDLIETFKIINGISDGKHSIFLLELEIYSQDRFQKLNLPINWISFANIFLKQIAKSDIVKTIKIKLDDFRNNGKKK